MYLVSLLRDVVARTSRVDGDGLNVLSDGSTVHLVLYKFDTCRFCRRVFDSVDALQVNVEYRDIRRERRWKKELMEVTGKSQVPCLFVNGVPMHESADIIRWLEGRFRQAGG